jgi:diaminopimelate decarboxylase
MHALFNLLKTILLKISRSWQIRSGVRDLGLWGLDNSRNGHLSVQGLDTLDLVAEFGSPLLVVNKNRLTRDVDDLREAFKRAPSGSKILYSYKTNCIPGILAPMHAVGIGAEVISPYELWLARELGVPGEMILYNGVDKSDESLESAIRMGILSINIDHIEEIDRICAVASRVNRKANVGVRLALAGRSQFGLDIESGEALEVCKTIKSRASALSLQCLHIHLTSNAKDASSHKGFARTALEFLRRLKDETNLTIPYLDIGGGFGVPTTKNMDGIEYGAYRVFGVLPKPPRLEDWQPISAFMNEVIDTIEETCRRLGLEVPRLIIEPGRLVTSRAEFLLATVRTIKRRTGGPLFAITDAGRLSVTFPCDFEYHEVFVANRPHAHMDTLYGVMGRVCTSADWMFKNRLLPKLEVGEVLAVMDAGAYFSSYSSNFAFPRPAVVMVDEGRASVVRAAETFEHLTALDSYRKNR